MLCLGVSHSGVPQSVLFSATICQDALPWHSLQELVVTSLAQTDAVAKLLIEFGVFPHDGFMEKIRSERATYQAMLLKVEH